MSNAPAILVENLCKGYWVDKGGGRQKQRLEVLKDVSFQLNRGSFMALVGKNGSSKSTLLSIISGITAPSSGSVQVNGRMVSLLELGVGFHNDLTGEENARVYAAMLGLSRGEIQQRYSDMVRFGEMEEFMKMKVRHYSNGMKIRLAFGVALQTAPDILIADEIFSVGDEDFKRRCIDGLRQLRGKMSMILVEHNPLILKELCDHAIWLDKGSLIKKGGLEEVMLAYQSTGT